MQLKTEPTFLCQLITLNPHMKSFHDQLLVLRLISLRSVLQHGYKRILLIELHDNSLKPEDYTVLSIIQSGRRTKDIREHLSRSVVEQALRGIHEVRAHNEVVQNIIKLRVRVEEVRKQLISIENLTNKGEEKLADQGTGNTLIADFKIQLLQDPRIAQ